MAFNMIPTHWEGSPVDSSLLLKAMDERRQDQATRNFWKTFLSDPQDSQPMNEAGQPMAAPGGGGMFPFPSADQYPATGTASSGAQTPPGSQALGALNAQDDPYAAIAKQAKGLRDYFTAKGINKNAIQAMGHADLEGLGRNLALTQTLQSMAQHAQENDLRRQTLNQHMQQWLAAAPDRAAETASKLAQAAHWNAAAESQKTQDQRWQDFTDTLNLKGSIMSPEEIGREALKTGDKSVIDTWLRSQDQPNRPFSPQDVTNLEPYGLAGSSVVRLGPNHSQIVPNERPLGRPVGRMEIDGLTGMKKWVQDYYSPEEMKAAMAAEAAAAGATPPKPGPADTNKASPTLGPRGVARPRSPAEYNALKSGTQYIDPNTGEVLVKR